MASRAKYISKSTRAPSRHSPRGARHPKRPRTVRFDEKDQAQQLVAAMMQRAAVLTREASAVGSPSHRAEGKRRVNDALRSAQASREEVECILEGMEFGSKARRQLGESLEDACAAMRRAKSEYLAERERHDGAAVMGTKSEPLPGRERQRLLDDDACLNCLSWPRAKSDGAVAVRRLARSECRAECGRHDGAAVAAAVTSDGPRAETAAEARPGRRRRRLIAALSSSFARRGW